MQSKSLRTYLFHWYRYVKLRQLLLTVAALFALGLEIITVQINVTYQPVWYLIAVFMIGWVFFVVKPAYGQWVMLVILAVLILLPGSPQSLQLAGGVVLIVDCVIRHQMIPALLTVCITSPLAALHYGGFFYALVWAGCDLVAFALAWSARKILEEKESAHQRALQIERETEHRLAGRIHDTAARDLSRTLILIERKKDEAGNCAQPLTEIESELRESLEHLQTLINTLDGFEKNESRADVTSSLHQVESQLHQANLETQFNVSGDFADLVPFLQELIADTINELAANALKYSDPYSAVELNLERTDDFITISESNRVRPEIPAALQGGSGLGRLAYRIETHGGSIAGQAVGNMWIVQAKLPAYSSRDNLPD